MLDLATALRESAVDVVLDTWDLKEGHDVVAVMERMGTDAGIEKVIMVFDRRYVEKANDWSGGVGTEAQIITSQIYERSDQDKFIGVIAEVEAGLLRIEITHRPQQRRYIRRKFRSAAAVAIRQAGIPEAAAWKTARILK